MRFWVLVLLFICGQQNLSKAELDNSEEFLEDSETTTTEPSTTTTEITTTTDTTTTTTTTNTTTTTTVPPNPSDCRLDWLDTPEGCYLFDFSSCVLGCSWLEASEKCIERGGHLVEITSEPQWKIFLKHLYLVSQLTHTEELKWWIGGHKTDRGYIWFSSGQNITYFDWSLSESPTDPDTPAAIYLAKAENQSMHKWHSGSVDESIGHPICEQ